MYGLVTLGDAVRKWLQLQLMIKIICVHANDAHSLLGHPGGEDIMRATTLALGCELKRGRMHKREPCAIGKKGFCMCI